MEDQQHAVRSTRILRYRTPKEVERYLHENHAGIEDTHRWILQAWVICSKPHPMPCVSKLERRSGADIWIRSPTEHVGNWLGYSMARGLGAPDGRLRRDKVWNLVNRLGDLVSWTTRSIWNRIAREGTSNRRSLLDDKAWRLVLLNYRDYQTKHKITVVSSVPNF